MKNANTPNQCIMRKKKVTGDYAKFEEEKNGRNSVLFVCDSRFCVYQSKRNTIPLNRNEKKKIYDFRKTLELTANFPKRITNYLAKLNSFD